MGIFNEFFRKEKPVFTRLKFGFGSGSDAAASVIHFQDLALMLDGINSGNGY